MTPPWGRLSSSLLSLTLKIDTKSRRLHDLDHVREFLYIHTMLDVRAFDRFRLFFFLQEFQKSFVAIVHFYNLAIDHTSLVATALHIADDSHI